MRAFSAARCLVLAILTWAAMLSSGKAAVSNVSALLQIPAGGSSPAIGFVVANSLTGILVRAVGPSLRAFSVPNPATSPQLHFFTSAGQEIALGTTILVSPTWPQLFASIGAFQLPATGDSYTIVYFEPGAYTITATDPKGVGGAVLLELYFSFSATTQTDTYDTYGPNPPS